MPDYTRVYQYLKAHARKGYCNECVARQTEIDLRYVQEITLKLRQNHLEFTRWFGSCAQCKLSKHVVTMAF